MNVKPVFVRDGYKLIGQTLVNENDPDDTFNRDFLSNDVSMIILMVEIELQLTLTYGLNITPFETAVNGLYVNADNYSFYISQIYVEQILGLFNDDIKSCFLTVNYQTQNVNFVSAVKFKDGPRTRHQLPSRGDAFKKMPYEMNSHILSFLPVEEQAKFAGNIVGDEMVPLDITYNQYVRIYHRHNVDKTQIKIIRNFTGITRGVHLPGTLQELYCDRRVQFTEPLPSQLKVLVCEDTPMADYFPNGSPEFVSRLSLNLPRDSLPPLAPLVLPPYLPDTLVTLICNRNRITMLPPLPPSLEVLECYYNNLTTLPPLPPNLKDLSCDDNLLTSLPDLPSSLNRLFCGYNQLTSLPDLPSSLRDLGCNVNFLTNLPSLPPNLVELYCIENRLTSLPELPSKLSLLLCQSNLLTSLPDLPRELYGVECDHNKLTTLPELPESLHVLSCSDNQLTFLPELPENLEELRCNHNQLTDLPELPQSLRILSYSDNPLESMPQIPVDAVVYND